MLQERQTDRATAKGKRKEARQTERHIDIDKLDMHSTIEPHRRDRQTDREIELEDRYTNIQTQGEEERQN